jgi:hypothetical protein
MNLWKSCDTPALEIGRACEHADCGLRTIYGARQSLACTIYERKIVQICAITDPSLFRVILL